MSDHDPLCPWAEYATFWGAPPRSDSPCRCSLIARIRADERERVAVAIEREKLDPKAQGRLTVENRNYPLTPDHILIINGVRNGDAEIARRGGSSV